MKKVLHISKYYYPFRGGTEQTAQDCVNSLMGRYEQKVFCFNDGKEDHIDNVDGIEVIRTGCIAKVASQSLSLSYGKLLNQTIRSYSPDIIIFHYPNPFAALFLLRWIPKSCKLVVYWHLDIVKQKILKRLFNGQNKRLIQRANILISTSPAYIECSPWLKRARNKCVAIPSCINEKRLALNPEVIETARKIRNDYSDKIICFAVGRHTEYKGFQYLIQAAHLLDDNFRVFIAGRGEETENLKAEAGEDQKIVFLGPVRDDELKAYYVAMDIFCFPSITKNEAFGLALAEGMYFGKPAVTFTIPGSGVNYVCINGENGLEVPNRDVEQYAAALKKLAANEKMRKQMGAAGKKRVEEHFLFKQYQLNICNLVDSL